MDREFTEVCDNWTLIGDDKPDPGSKNNDEDLICAGSLPASDSQNDSSCEEDKEPINSHNDQEKISEKDTLKVPPTELDDESDGISIISQQNSDVEDNNKVANDSDVAQGGLDWGNGKCSDCQCQFPTPPCTPFEGDKPEKLDKGQQSNIVSCDKELQTVANRELAEIVGNPHLETKKFNYWILALVVAIIAAVLGGKVLHLRQAFELSSKIYQKQITDLQNENVLLRNQLENLRLTLQNVNLFADEVQDDLTLEMPATNPQFKKKVWTGAGKNEKLIEIPDKEFQLPAYCSEKKDDQLFDEYNQKLCDIKRKKLENKIKKVEKLQSQEQLEKSKENMDKFRVNIESILDLEPEPEKSYDELMSEATSKLWDVLKQEADDRRKSSEVTVEAVEEVPKEEESQNPEENSENEEVIFASTIQSDPQPDGISNDEIEQKIQNKEQKTRFNGGFKRGFSKIVISDQVEAPEKQPKIVRKQWESDEQDSGENFDSKDFEEWKEKIEYLQRHKNKEMKKKQKKAAEDFQKTRKIQDQGRKGDEENFNKQKKDQNRKSMKIVENLKAEEKFKKPIKKFDGEDRRENNKENAWKQEKNLKKLKSNDTKKSASEKFKKYDDSYAKPQKISEELNEKAKKFEGSGKPRNKKEKKNGEWQERLMHGREEMRKATKDNWYVERSREREINRMEIQPTDKNRSNF